ncbi:hypothetical protein SCUP234_05372 [Seiridium cupressi]
MPAALAYIYSYTLRYVHNHRYPPYNHRNHRNIDTNMPSDKKEKTSPKPPPPKEKPPPAPRPGFAKLHDPKPPPQLPPK